MNSLDLRSISISATCPHCHAVNALTVSDVPDYAKVNCSICHEPLGSLGDLRRPPQREGNLVAAE